MAGITLRSWRRDRQLSQRHLAERVGTKQSHISEIETGTTDVTVGTLADCFDAMGLELIITARPKRAS